MSTTQDSIPPLVIEITDSSDDSENEEEEDSHQHSPSITDPSTPDESTTGSADTFRRSERQPPTVAIVEKEETKKIHNRRKSVHHSIRSMENLSFETVLTRGKRTESEQIAREIKKKRWDESSIDAAIDDSIDDEEITKMLKKIAYCRVFTNYLLRQYDMLAIDFKLYSNIDLLMLQLKKRVDTYTAIRRSRQQLLLNKENGGIV